MVPPRYDREFGFIEMNFAGPERPDQPALDDAKHLILIPVTVPDHLTLNLGEFCVLAVETGATAPREYAPAVRTV